MVKIVRNVMFVWMVWIVSIVGFVRPAAVGGALRLRLEAKTLHLIRRVALGFQIFCLQPLASNLKPRSVLLNP